MSKITVDHRGLQAIVRERGEVTLLDELVQNALDTDARVITVEISSPATNRVRVEVLDDDPTGFLDLSHANTLFAPSVKRDDASKRGFMNVGDKLAVAYAVAGEIISTTGSRRVTPTEVYVGRKRRSFGTVVDLTFPMSKEMMTKLIARAHTYLVGPGITFTVNGTVVPTAAPVDVTKAKLGLYVADENGDMKVSQLVTQLDLYEPDHRGSWIYVLGIPVQRVDELPRSVDVRGRLKVDIKRDQIPDRELHRIKVAVADALAAELTHEDVTGWARSTMEDASPAVVQKIVAEIYGTDAMVANPSDPSANIRATEEGRTLIPTRAFAAGEWERVRELRAVDPSFAPTTSSEYGATIGGVLDEAIPEDMWMIRETEVVEYAHKVFAQLFPGCRLDVTVYGGKKADCIAAMGRTGNTGHLSLVRGDWVEDQLEVLDTIIHEFAHFAANGHGHSIRWGESCSDIGARIALLGMLPS